MASLGALKVGIAVVCVAGAAGSYAVCAHLGIFSPPGFGPHPRQRVIASPFPSRHRLASHISSRARVPGLVTDPIPSSPVESATVATGHRSSTTRAKHHHWTTVAQTRREFGPPVAHAADPVSAAEPSSAVATHTASPAAASSAPASTHQARETQAEFGFER
jgi:hypothetical protein